MSLCVVTGGAGFIGSNLVRALCREGHDVRVVDDLSSGRRANLAEVESEIRFFEGDIADDSLLKEACAGADVVFHQAAVASVQASVEEPIGTNRTNVEGTLRVLEASRTAGVRRVVYASSSAVYGDVPGHPKREQMPARPTSPYGVGKLAGEQYCCVFSRLFDLEAVALRYFNVYGPRQDPHSEYAAVIPAFCQAVLRGERPRVFGDGEQTRDFVFVDDIVQANLKAASVPEAAGQAINVGSGREHCLNELLQVLREVSGRETDPEYCEGRPGDIRRSAPDIGRARRLLDFQPTVELADGLRRTYKWYRTREGRH